MLNAADNEDAQSECLLCLSSPREVVLLPCRHLVACKDCALNMVEFGAGGNITQAGEVNEGANGVTPVTPVTAGTATSSLPFTPVPPTANNRRKRKAKGWFCPVCRQRKCIILQNKLNKVNTLQFCLAYTSMLRITTTPPPQLENKDAEGSGTEDEGSPTLPTANSNVATAEVTDLRGLLGSALRPGFLRGLSLSRNAPVANPDVESRAGLGRVGA